MRLTTLGIEGLKAPQRQKTFFDDAVPGFGVRVGKNTKTFVLMVGRQRRLVSIGRYPIVGLKEARTAALRLLADHDPLKQPPARLRFAEAAERFMEEKRAQIRFQTRRQYDRTLNIYLKHLHSKHLDEVTTDDITRVTDRLLKEKKGSSANHLLVAAKTFFKWCVKRRLILHSPAEGLDKPAKEFARERVLSDDELRAVWKASYRVREDFGTIVRLLILTGQRRGEIASLKVEWCSVAVACMGESPVQLKTEDYKHRPENTICIPSSNTKNSRTHTFPIGPLAASLLSAATENISGFLFPARARANSPFASWSKSKADLDKETQIAAWTLHDLRRTYAVNLQRLKIRTEVIECLLNHRSGYKSGVTGIYQRYDFWEEMVDATTRYEEWFQRIILMRQHEELTLTVPQV